MKTEISRDSHQPEKRYSGVYQQQGRMLTDADWNELVDILKDRLNEALKDVVGSKQGSIGGTPRHRALKINDDLSIQPGHVYIDGIAALVTGDSPLAYESQLDFPSPPTPSGEYRLYADVWERTVTQLMDERLRDKGLHGADTCSRKQMMAQVKWCPVTIDPETSAKNPSKGDANLSVTLLNKTTESDPCDPCADELDVESRIGNYLFRVEVHEVTGDANAPTGITLKWSSENAAEQFEAEAAIEDMPAGFVSDKWAYEFFDETSEKHTGVHLDDTTWQPLRGVLTEIKEPGSPYSIPADFAASSSKFVRRWDGYCRLDLASGMLTEGVDRGVSLSTDKAVGALGHVGIGSSLTVILDSIKLDMVLSSKSFVAGDFWLAEVREAEHSVDSVLIADQLPNGIVHHYLTLGNVEAGSLLPNAEMDRKYNFPPLTQMTRIFMAGGDGQEVMPGEPLPQPLRVGVGNGEWPVQGATVRFTIEDGGGTLNLLNEGLTDADGIAECEWSPGAVLGDTCRVKAALVDPDNSSDASKDINPPVYFYANLITADQVAYVPGCADSGENTTHSLLAEEASVGLDIGSDTYYSVKEVLDALLCKMRARHIPYDPTNSSRWDDVNEEEGASAPDTVQKAIDALLENLQSEDIVYPLPDCSPHTNTLKFYLQSFIDQDSRDAPDRYRISALWDALLCHLDAAKLPYNPNQSAVVTARWRDIKEVTGSGILAEPNTVQEAIDELIRWLESTDIRYEVPSCGTAALPSVRSLLPIAPGTTKIDTVLDKLLCDFKATHLPMDKDDSGLCDYLKDADSVQDALRLLCDRPVGGGCSITVGPGEQYETIQEVFGTISIPEITICLLPGEHRIVGNLDSSDKRSIKITGAGAHASRVYLQGDINFDASQIILLDFGIWIIDDPEKSTIGSGQISLGKDKCERVDVQRCHFSRTVDSKEAVIGPLVSVNTNILRWQKNDLEAKLFIAGFQEAVIPDDIASRPEVAAQIDVLNTLWGGNTALDKTGVALDKAVAEAAAIIKGLPASDRAAWLGSKSEQAIDGLPKIIGSRTGEFLGSSVSTVIDGDAIFPASARNTTLLRQVQKVSAQDSVNGFYDMLTGADTMNVAEIIEVLVTVVLASYEDDTALAVGGKPEYAEIAYNTIDGILCLQADFTDQIPVSPTGTNIAVSRIDFVTASAGVGILQGNILSRVISKIPSGSLVDGVITNPLEGFDQLSLSANVFSSTGNSFICNSLNLQGNRFSGLTRREVVALAIAKTATFTANLSGTMTESTGKSKPGVVTIQRLIEDKRQSANQLLFLDTADLFKPAYKYSNGEETAAGTVMAFSDSSPPQGWRECNGSQLDREEYSALFSAIGIQFGAGNGATSFNIPDLRGEFVRGWDHSRGVDAGREFSQPQSDQLKNHSHSYDRAQHTIPVLGVPIIAPPTYLFFANNGASTSSSPGASAVETRPRNIAMLYCIKI